jgi:Ca2+-binding RTX toxin-like protein
VFYPGAGDDIMRGGRASDPIEDRNTAWSSPGNDVMLAGGGWDFFKGGKGNDFARLGAGEDTFYGGLGADTMVASPGRDVFYGGRGSDTMVDDKGSDVAWPEAGRDNISTGHRDDILRVEDDGVRDRIDCGPGKHDSVYAPGGIDPKDTYIGCEDFRTD